MDNYFGNKNYNKEYFKDMNINIVNENRCVVCGEVIPEGRIVCWICEHGGYSKLKIENNKREQRRKTEQYKENKRWGNLTSCGTK